MRSGRATLRTAFLVLGVLVGIWALIVLFTGGFVTTVGPFRISSRSARNPLLFASLGFTAAFALSTSAERRRAIPAAVQWFNAQTPTLSRLLAQPPAYLAPALAATAAALVAIVAMREGAFYASGADVYGYVSQADRWLHGGLRSQVPQFADPRWKFPKEILVPLGYRLNPDSTMVPTYAAGLPLTMALFQMIGGARAVFYVVPIMSGVLVWCTYLLGTRYAGKAVGLGAALLMASSPVFLFQIMFAMSDVPVAAWWTLAFAALLRPGWLPALAAGLAGSAAILTRPNLVLLAAVPGVLLVLYAAGERPRFGPAWRRLLSFTAGVVPGCVAVGVINYWLYDSPLMSGYGDLNQYYSRANIPVNARLYPQWILQTQTALILLAFLAPFLARHRLASGETGRSVGWMWIGLVLATVGSLLPYLIFDHWFYLRLVLSVFPVLFVLMMFVLYRAASPLPAALQSLLLVVVVGTLTWRGTDMAYRNGAFVFREGERKSQAIGEYVARALPANAALVSMQHSGTVRYYSGRLTVRWDFVASANQLEPVLDTLRSMGYRPYILLENWEVPLFKERFGATPVGALDWPPRAKLEHASRILLWDPADRAAAAAGRPVRTDYVY